MQGHLASRTCLLHSGERLSPGLSQHVDNVGSYFGGLETGPASRQLKTSIAAPYSHFWTFKCKTSKKFQPRVSWTFWAANFERPTKQTYRRRFWLEWGLRKLMNIAALHRMHRTISSKTTEVHSLAWHEQRQPWCIISTHILGSKVQYLINVLS